MEDGRPGEMPKFPPSGDEELIPLGLRGPSQVDPPLGPGSKLTLLGVLFWIDPNLSHAAKGLESSKAGGPPPEQRGTG